MSILLDPYLSDMVERLDNVKRLVPSPIRAQDVHPGLYRITHDHIDHLDADAITKLNRVDTMTFGNFSFEAVYAKHTTDSIG